MQQLYDDSLPPALQDTLKQHADAHRDIHRDTQDASAEQHTTQTLEAVSLVYQDADAYKTLHLLEDVIQEQIKPRIRIIGRLYSAYHSFGFMGIVLAVSIAYGLTLARGLSLWVITALLGLTLLLSILNIVLTTIITGKDSLVFLRYFLSIMAGGVVLLRMLNQPVLPYLENLMLGIGAMQGIGRIGCLKVGCCYGKPAAFGIRYSNLHASAGFPAFLVGARLFPIQLLESSWILLSAAISISIALFSGQLGYGLATHLVLFSTGRFCLELLRGDNARTYWGQFSEAQWLSLSMVWGVMLFEAMQWLPLHTWHLAIGITLTGFFVFLIFTEQWSYFSLRTPDTIHALSKSLALLNKSRDQGLAGSHAIHLRQIDPDLQISDGVFNEQTYRIHHYTISYAHRTMPAKDAARIAKLIQSWHPREEKSKLIHHYKNTFHFLRYQMTES